MPDSPGPSLTHRETGHGEVYHLYQRPGDIARDKEQDSLELALCDRLAMLETAIVSCAGVAGFERFLAWARTEDPDYVPPMVDGCSAWEEAGAHA